MAKNQQELDFLLQKYKGNFKELHLDVVDGKFAPSHSLDFSFKLSPDFIYQAHLMVKQPEKWIKKYGHLVNLCIPQIEELPDLAHYIQTMKQNNSKIAFALKPETKVELLQPYANQIDSVLILAVHPGFYGSKFLRASLRKIAQIRKLNLKIKIIVDGGMVPQTIGFAREVDGFVSGSYLAQAAEVKKAAQELRKALRECC